MTILTSIAPATLGTLFPKTVNTKTTLLPPVVVIKPIAIDGGKSSLVNPFKAIPDRNVPSENVVNMYRSYLYEVVFKGAEPSIAANEIVTLNPNCGVRIVLGKFPGRATMIRTLKRMVFRLKADGDLHFSAPLPHGKVLKSFAEYVVREELQIN